jgi:hypothetical protein
MQKKTKLISAIIASTAVFFALAPQSKQIAQEAPLSRLLFRQPCVNTGIGNWSRRTEDVSVGKAVYTSRLFMGPGNRSASMTCKLVPNEAGVIFQRLRLSFGMRDNDKGSPPVNVNIYLDGRRAEARTVSPGQGEVVTLNVTSTSNVAIESICSNQYQYCDRVYFWEAELEYPPIPQK